MYACSWNLLAPPTSLRSLTPSSCNVHSSKASTGTSCVLSKYHTRLTIGSLFRCMRFPAAPAIIEHGREKRMSDIRAVLTEESSTTSTMEEETENIGLFAIDPALEAYKDHFKYRIKRYLEQKRLIETYEGSLEEFAQGYLKFGFNREEGCTLYNEWAPAAQEAEVIGDFNGWNGSNHKMEKNQFGVWSIRILDSGRNPAIPPNSRVKFRFKHGNRLHHQFTHLRHHRPFLQFCHHHHHLHLHLRHRPLLQFCHHHPLRLLHLLPLHHLRLPQGLSTVRILGSSRALAQYTPV